MIRIALGRVITQQWFSDSEQINVICLNVNLERLLLQTLQNTNNFEPGLAEHIIQQLQQALHQQEAIGAPPVLLVNHSLRAMLAQFLRPNFPQLAVIRYNLFHQQKNRQPTINSLHKMPQQNQSASLK